MKSPKRSQRLETKRSRHSQSESESESGDDNDRLSDLPNSILLHIMSFLMIKDAVQTCILSKRWKDLWKSLTNITLHTSDFSRPSLFSEFVSGIVSCRDGNHPLHILDFNRHGYFQPQILSSLMRYAVSHDVQQLRIYVPYNLGLPSCVFSCRSLTSLDISVSPYDVKKRTKIPVSLELPALVILHLKNVVLSTNDNGCAEPFSTCKRLNTLYIDRCLLISPDFHHILDKSGLLSISNNTLANLTINNYSISVHKIVVSTPNLSSFTLNGSPFQIFCGQAGVNVELQSSSLI